MDLLAGERPLIRCQCSGEPEVEACEPVSGGLCGLRKVAAVVEAAAGSGVRRAPGNLMTPGLEGLELTSPSQVTGRE